MKLRKGGGEGLIFKRGATIPLTNYDSRKISMFQFCFKNFILKAGYPTTGIFRGTLRVFWRHLIYETTLNWTTACDRSTLFSKLINYVLVCTRATVTALRILVNLKMPKRNKSIRPKVYYKKDVLKTFWNSQKKRNMNSLFSRVALWFEIF